MPFRLSDALPSVDAMHDIDTAPLLPCPAGFQIRCRSSGVERRDDRRPASMPCGLLVRCGYALSHTRFHGESQLPCPVGPRSAAARAPRAERTVRFMGFHALRAFRSVAASAEAPLSTPKTSLYALWAFKSVAKHVDKRAAAITGDLPCSVGFETRCGVVDPSATCNDNNKLPCPAGFEVSFGRQRGRAPIGWSAWLPIPWGPCGLLRR